MFGSMILDVAIGLIFVFILASLVCSAIREGLEAILKTRAGYLKKGIRELLMDKNGDGIALELYKHPIVYSLFSGEPGQERFGGLWGSNLPSYIPSKNFALALMDLAARGKEIDAKHSDMYSPVISLENIRMNISNLENPYIQRVLLTAIDSAQGDLNKLQQNLEAWYDSAMDRVSGWYKRSTQWIIFCIGFIVAFALNINTITIADYLYHNDSARAVLVARADTASTDKDFLNKTYSQVKAEINAMSLPIGWEKGWASAWRPNSLGSIWDTILAPFLGWFLTAFAVSMGAPFWFDMLNKVMVIRSTVKPHEKSPEEASEDRQLPEVQKVENRTTVPRTNQTALDSTSELDGCNFSDINPTDSTSDDQLPAAQGGVA